MLAIIIPAAQDKPITQDAVPTAPEGVAEWLRGKVGGHLECVRLSDGRDMWINEEGKLEGLPINAAATGLALLNGIGDVIAGPAVILGNVGADTIGLNRDQFLTTCGELLTPVTVAFLR